jgi:hypothetical protein
MARITDANLAFAGQEPKFSTELTQSDLMRSLAWYAQNKDKSDAFKYACDYFKKKLKIDASAVLKSEISTFGFVCRILTNGGSLPESNRTWFEQEITKIKKRLDNVVVVEEEPEQPKIAVNIQDRIREKASEVIGELEGQIDELILSKFEKFNTPFPIYTINDIGCLCLFFKSVLSPVSLNHFYVPFYLKDFCISQNIHSLIVILELFHIIFLYFVKIVIRSGRRFWDKIKRVFTLCKNVRLHLFFLEKLVSMLFDF